MGNNKFKFSNMIPNVLFHKLKDTTKTKHKIKNNNKNKNTVMSEQEQEQESKQQPDHFNPRKSYYITKDLVPINGLHVSEDPPRKSSKKLHSPKKRILRSSPEVVSSSISAGCRCRSKPEYSASSSSFSVSDDDDSQSPELPPIITKPAKFNEMVTDIKKNKERAAPVRKYGANSPGVRLRVNSPKIRSKKIQGLARKSVSSSTSSSSSLSESFAVVKSSFDPQRDFRESMVEMISENNITASKDLEDLLACYLSLNSDEYHDLIIKVFKQIWFDLNDVQFKS